MRSLLLLLTLAAGYALLRGWPSDWHPVVRITLAGTALIATLWFWGKTNKSSTPDALPAKRPGLIDFAGIAIVLLLRVRVRPRTRVRASVGAGEAGLSHFKLAERCP
ncbi:MAG: hypothetical protein ACPGAP_06545, partial [Akkermansiaceae bacterium]